jgi:hypothetical protein
MSPHRPEPIPPRWEETASLGWNRLGFPLFEPWNGTLDDPGRRFSGPPEFREAIPRPTNPTFQLADARPPQETLGAVPGSDLDPLRRRGIETQIPLQGTSPNGRGDTGAPSFRSPAGPPVPFSGRSRHLGLRLRIDRFDLPPGTCREP